MGITTEGMVSSRRKEKYGEIRDYIPNRYVNEPIGFPSDDTQLSFWMLEQLIHDGAYVPERVANAFISNGKIFGIGRTVRKFIENMKHGKPWYASGPESAGNGALMRIPPILLPHLNTGGTGLWVDTVLAAMTTHNDYASNAACLGFAAMLWELLDMHEAPDALWWPNRYVELTQGLEDTTHLHARGGSFSEYEGPLWRFVEEKTHWAYSRDLSTLEACNAWFSGAYLLETVPCVLYILMQHAHDPEEAIVRAVNDTKDNDTIAAIVGAAVGVLHGKKNMPKRWIDSLSGRTSFDDNGKVFELIEKAKQVFWGDSQNAKE